MDKYRIKPGEKVDLSQWDPNDKSYFPVSKSEGKKQLLDLNEELESLQELLFAEGKQKVLIILQAMDTGGKDGVIRHVFDGVNPQGVKVASFKVPSKIELAHDYLWRIHQHTPGKGEITIFNRSHYEDVLVVRVHNLVPVETWSRRYDHITAFENMLVDEGTTILKFYLHIDKDEQKERLQARLDEPNKNWKFSKGDLEERKLWNEYQTAFETAIERTSTENSPWYIIPANRKWYRNLVISTIIINKLKSLNMTYPPAEDDLEGIVIE
jgi:PPK2 family polyphosphate:nucleotide phosphotransferase